MCTDDHRPDIFGEKCHQRRRERQTQHSADHHNARAQRKRYLKNTADAFPLTRTVVVTDHRTHTLNNAARRQIQESLQFVIDAEHDHIRLTELSQQRIQTRDEQ